MNKVAQSQKTFIIKLFFFKSATNGANIKQFLILHFCCRYEEAAQTCCSLCANAEAILLCNKNTFKKHRLEGHSTV